MQYGFAAYNSAPPVPDPMPDQMMHGGYGGEGNMMMMQHQQQHQQQQWGQQQQQQWPQNEGMMMQQQPMMEQPMDQNYDQGQQMVQMGGMGGEMMQMQHGSDMMQMPMGGEMMHHPGQQAMSGYQGAGAPADDDKGISKNTVYVGGLPIPGAPDAAEAVDEAGLHNFFFSHCGAIKGIRMQPNRGCCFVEFENDASAAQAILLNGTYAALKPELPNSTIRIMVRYAYARPKRAPGYQPREHQQMAMRPGHEQGYGMGGGAWDAPWDASGGGTWPDGGNWRTGTRWDTAGGSRWQAQAGRPRSPSPERIPRYTESENRKLKELLKKSVEEIESTDPNSMSLLSGAPSSGGGILLHAINTVLAWMEAGECGKKTADNFYVYLQNIHAKVLELQKYEEQRAKQRQDEDMAFYTSLNAQHDAALKAFNEARKQKVKDNFSKVQRKNVDRWVAAAAGGSRKYSSYLGIAVAEEDMEVEAQRLAQAGQADEPGSPEGPDAPPPPPSSGEQRLVKRQKPEEQQPEQSEGHMSLLSSRINALERLLMEKLEGKQEKAEVKPEAPEAGAVKQEAAGPAAPAAAVAAEAPSAADPTAVCVVAALAVYMASFPKGAKMSQLCAYVSSLCYTEGDAAEPNGSGPMEERSVESMVTAALTLAPGVFTQGTTAGGDPTWSLTALQMLQRVKVTPQV